MESQNICNVCYQNDSSLRCKKCQYDVCMECIYAYGFPKCPDCKTLYEKDVIPDIHKQYVLNTFRQFLRNDKLFLVRKKMVNFSSDDNIELIKTCPKCLKYIVKKDGEGVCISCGYKICLECEENHKGPCDDIDLINKKFLNEKYMKCPMCLTYIDKIDGCKHMRCLSCGSQFNSENSKEIYYRKFNYMEIRDNSLTYSNRVDNKLTDLDSSIQYYDYLNPFKTLHLGELINNYLLERRCKGLETIHSLIKPFLEDNHKIDDLLYKLLKTNQTIEEFNIEYDPQVGKESLYTNSLYSSLFFVIDNIIQMNVPLTYCIRNITIHGNLPECFDKYKQEDERQKKHIILKTNKTFKFMTSNRLSTISESNDSYKNISDSCSLIKEINPHHLVVFAHYSEKDIWIKKLLSNNVSSKTDIVFYDDIETKTSNFFSLYEGEEFIKIVLDDYMNDLVNDGRAMVIFGRISTSPNIILISFLKKLVNLIKKNKTIFHIHGLVEYDTNEIFHIFKPLLDTAKKRLRENIILSQIRVLEIELNSDEKIFYSQCFTNMGIVLDSERYITNMCNDILNIKGLIASENLLVGKMINLIPLTLNQNIVIGVKFDSTIKYIKNIYINKGITPLVINHKSDLSIIRNCINIFQNTSRQILLLNINVLKKIPILTVKNNIHINAFLYTDFDFYKTISFISIFNKPISSINIIDPNDSVNSIDKLQQYIWCDIQRVLLKDIN